jgi:DNA-binding transcriptional ArsR family regulator
MQSRDPELVRKLADAMADPIRARLLAAVSDKPGLSIRQIADRIGEPGRKVRYHLEALQAEGLVEVEGQGHRRGAVERYFRTTTEMIITESEESQISAAKQRRISLEVLKLVMADATSSVASGYFGTREGHAEVRLRGELDESGWREMADLLVRATTEAEEIILRSAGRVSRSDEEGVEVTAALLLFEAPARTGD